MNIVEWMALALVVGIWILMMISMWKMQMGGNQSSKKATAGNSRYDQRRINRIMSEFGNCDVTAEKKARGVIKLLEIGYISIHKILNEGENYNDKKQQESFKKYLDEERVAKLQRVGRDE